ncbi:MAG: sigma 54-interacting transcriptional regulator, partial [Bacillota bacterium]
RVIAATNYNLAREVKAGRFRSDLYHRLEVLGLELPPLRARKEDIGLLARHFVRQLSLQEGKSVPQLNAPALDRLKRYDWPGNIRELQNVILKYVLLIEEGQDPAELVERLIGEKLQLRNQSAVTGAGETITLRIGRLEDMEREVIRYLKSTGRSSAEIARLLGTSRTTLWRKTRA